jgi:hypothetical protein
MKTFVLLVIGVCIAVCIYWLMDWQSHHEDGE